MGYKFSRNEEASYSSHCGFEDICLNADKGAYVREGECAGINEEGSITFTILNCNVNEYFDTFVIEFRDSNVITSDRDYEACEGVCGIDVSSSTSTTSSSVQSTTESGGASFDVEQRKAIIDARIKEHMENSYSAHHTIYAPNFTTVCPNFVSPTPSEISPNSTTTSPKSTQIIPPPIPTTPDCKDGVVAGIYCDVLKTEGNPANISQVLQETLTAVTNSTVSGTDIYYAGAILFSVTRNVSAFNKELTTNTLDIISKVASQPVELLKNASSDKYLLWYAVSINNLIVKSTNPIDYQSPESLLFVKSWNNATECKNNADRSYCFDKNGIPIDKKTGAFCITVEDTNSLCDSSESRYITMTPVKFYILGSNGGNEDNETKNEGIQFDTNASEDENNVPTSSDVGKCYCENITITSHSANAGQVNNDFIVTSVAIKITYFHSKTVNDLNRKPYIAAFAGTYFISESEMDRSHSEYTYQCGAVSCTAQYSGCSSSPLVCYSWLQVILGLGSPLTLIILVFGTTSYILSTRGGPPPACINCLCFKCLPSISYNFKNHQLPVKTRYFSLIYNSVFFIYLALMFFGNSKTFVSSNACTIIAGFNYFFYLTCVIMSMLNVLVASQALKNWRSGYETVLMVFVGKESIKSWPAITAILISLAISGTSALVLPEFMQRSDDFCWIRPDYQFFAIWVPMILLGCTIPFYIPLLARCWPNFCLFEGINSLFVKDLELLKSKEPNQNNRSESNEPEKWKRQSYSVSELCFRLLLPQILIGLPVIIDSLVLYMTKMNPLHAAFVVIVGFQVFISFLLQLCFYKKDEKKKKNKENRHHSRRGSNESSGRNNGNLHVDPYFRIGNQQMAWNRTSIRELDKYGEQVRDGRVGSNGTYFSEEPIIPRPHTDLPSTSAQGSSLRHESSTISSPTIDHNSPHDHTRNREAYGSRNPRMHEDSSVPSDWDKSDEEYETRWVVENMQPIPLSHAILRNASSSSRYENYREDLYNRQNVNRIRIPQASTSSNQSSERSRPKVRSRKGAQQDNRS